MVLSRQLGFISRSLVVGNSMSIITLSDRLSKFLMVAAAAWAFGLAFLIMADIVGRTVFSKPIYGTAEMVAASVVIVVFLQAGYAIRSRSMLRADFLVILLPDKVQRVLLAIGYLLGAGFFLMIITGGWEESVRSFIQGEYEGGLDGCLGVYGQDMLNRIAGIPFPDSCMG
jgi:TRAP-type C4-dicarboxylate transport system permease small subunit